jgi:phospholipase/carboxylesterase
MDDVVMADVLPAIEIETSPQPDASVIWLHGLGDTGDGWSQVVPGLALPPTMRVRFLFPHAPRMPVAINNGFVMPAWYDIREANLAERADVAGVRQSQRALEALVARENARGVEDARIVLAGFSQGGAVALYTGLRHPRRLAGIVALSTYLVGGEALATEASPANRDVPIFMAHGTYDPVASRVGASVARRPRAGRVERRMARVPDGAFRHDGGGGGDRPVPAAGAATLSRKVGLQPEAMQGPRSRQSSSPPLSSFTGRGCGRMPRRASASRNRNSTCAFALRSSAWASRSTAAHNSGSTRSRNDFLPGIAR